MAEPALRDAEAGAVRQASAGAHGLAAAMPRLVLEARRLDRDPRPARAPPRRLRREFLAVPPLRLRRARAERRLAPLGARRPSLCPRARMGSLAHGVDLAGPLAVDGVRLEDCARVKARAHA